MGYDMVDRLRLEPTGVTARVMREKLFAVVLPVLVVKIVNLRPTIEGVRGLVALE
jgi:hypothetical protein